MTKLKNIFVDPLFALLCVFFALLPFVFFTANVESPFELPKYIFSCFAIIAMIFFFAFRTLREDAITLRGTRTLQLLLLFFVVQSLSYLFSINPYVSFWGDFFLPADSWLSVALFTCLAVLATQLINSTERARAFASVIAGTAGLISLHGALQQAGLEVFPQWSTHNLQNGVFALIGQPVGFASVLGMSAPVLLALFFIAKKPLLNWLLGSLIFLLNLSILYSSSRMPILTNFFMSAAFLALLYRHRALLLSLRKLLIAAALIFSANLFFYATATSTLGKKFELGEISRSSNPRLLIWQEGIQAWLRHPILGSGPETFSIVQLELQSAEMNKTGYWNNYWAKAHNYIIQCFTSTGLLGLASLLAMIFYVAFNFFNVFRKKELTENQLLAAGFMAGFLFLQIANITAFNFIVTQVYSYIFLVLAGVLLQEFNLRTFQFVLPPRFRILTLLFLFITLLPLGFWINSYWKSDILYHNAIASHYKSNLLESIRSIDEAIALAPNNPINYCFKSDILMTMLKKNRSTLRSSAIADTVKVMDEASQACVDLGINRYQFTRSRGMVFGNLFYDGFITSSAVAEESFARLKQMIPSNPIPYYRTGLLYSVSGRQKQFVEQMQEALKLKADYIPAYKDLFLYYYSSKNSAAVQSLLQQALQVQLVTPEFLEDLKGLADIAAKNFDSATSAKLQQLFEAQKLRFRN